MDILQKVLQSLFPEENFRFDNVMGAGRHLATYSTYEANPVCSERIKLGDGKEEHSWSNSSMQDSYLDIFWSNQSRVWW